MKNILVSNKAWKELHKLKRTLNLRNNNQAVEYLLSYKKKQDLDKKISEIFGV